jgi:hypothetical protein
MDETKWASSRNHVPMLSYLRRERKFLLTKAGRRRMRLFACAAVRRVWELLTDPRCREAVETMELLADGRADEGQRFQAYKRALEAYYATHRAAAVGAALNSAYGAWMTCQAEAWRTRAAVRAALGAEAGRRPPREVAAPYADLLRDVFGNPFRPIVLDPAWVKWNRGALRGIAETIYQERAYERLPVLADALEDAGCDNADLLGHLRAPGTHVRGCWALDLLRGVP